MVRMRRSRAGCRRRTARLCLADPPERFGFLCVEPTAAGADEQAFKSAQGRPGDSGRAWSGFEHDRARFAVNIVKVPTQLREAQIDQPGEPTLGIGQFMGDKTPLPVHKLELLGVFFAWLQGDEITVAHSAGDKKRVIGIGFASRK
jgi:hypothetical protein